MPVPLAVGGFFATLLAFVLSRAIWSILSALGVGVLTYVGLDAFLQEFQAYADSLLSGVPAAVFDVFVTVNGPQAFNLILSAVSFRYTVGMMQRRLIFSPPAAGGGA